jgi:hypothetical protein
MINLLGASAFLRRMVHSPCKLERAVAGSYLRHVGDKGALLMPVLTLSRCASISFSISAPAYICLDQLKRNQHRRRTIAEPWVAAFATSCVRCSAAANSCDALASHCMSFAVLPLVRALAIQSSVTAATKATAMLIPPRMLKSFLVMKLPPFCG